MGNLTVAGTLTNLWQIKNEDGTTDEVSVTADTCLPVVFEFDKHPDTSKYDMVKLSLKYPLFTSFLD